MYTKWKHCCIYNANDKQDSNVYSFLLFFLFAFLLYVITQSYNKYKVTEQHKKTVKNVKT